MIARVLARPNVCFVLLMIVLTFPGCGRGISQFVTKPVQGSQNLSIDEITQMAGQSLQMMGYGIQEQNIPAGYIYARKRVVEDIYGRSTEIKINVQQGQVGEKVLGVEAFSCPGCIPEAHFSPSWMANQFYTYFDLRYKASARFAGTKASPVQGSPPPGSISGSPPITGKSADGPLSAPSPNIILTSGAVTTMGSLKIIEETRARAEQGDAEAQFKLGRMYAKGEGVPQDYVQAVAWFRKAAEQGNAKGQNGLGAMYGSGQGVPQDWVQAVVWFRKAAEQGEAMAQCNLGVMYANGQGVPQDYAEAAAWYRKAAEQGYAQAQFNLGLMYANGEGVRQDYAQALVWYRKAAEQGYAAAQFNLGGMYDFGRGVPQDYVEAHMWRNLAAARATGEDKKKFEDGRDDLAKSMTPAQVTEAQKRAQEWTEAFARRRTAQAEKDLEAARAISPPMTGKSAEGSLSAPSPNIVPTPGAATTMGSLKINKVEIDPTVVRAGSKFQIVADYIVADPETEEKEIPVLFSLSILEGSKVLYAPKATEIKSYNNKSTIRREPITAGAKKGVYKIKVSIQYNNLSAEGAADLRIE